MDKKMMILVCFFSVATFITSIISSCLVFYNEKARTDINSNKVVASNNIYKSSSINYYNGNNYYFNNVEPNSAYTKYFSITNNNSNQIKYHIEWQNIISNWYDPDPYGNIHANELVYSISCTDGQKMDNITVPNGIDNMMILSTQELKTNKTNNCSLTIRYIETGYDQSYNENKSFGGEFKIVIEE